MISACVRVRLDFAGHGSAVRGKDPREDVVAGIGGIGLPNHHETAVDGGYLGIRLVKSRRRVDLDFGIVKRCSVAGIAANENAPPGAVIADGLPGDGVAAIDRDDGRILLVARGIGIDENLATNRRAVCVEALGVDAAAYTVVLTEGGPGRDETAVYARDCGGLPGGGAGIDRAVTAERCCLRRDKPRCRDCRCIRHRRHVDGGGGRSCVFSACVVMGRIGETGRTAPVRVRLEIQRQRARAGNQHIGAGRIGQTGIDIQRAVGWQCLENEAIEIAVAVAAGQADGDGSVLVAAGQNVTGGRCGIVIRAGDHKGGGVGNGGGAVADAIADRHRAALAIGQCIAELVRINGDRAVAIVGEVNGIVVVVDDADAGGRQRVAIHIRLTRQQIDGLDRIVLAHRAGIDGTGHRHVVDRVHIDGHRFGVAVHGAVVGLVGEAVDTEEIGVGRVGERTVRIQRQAAVQRARDDRCGQRVVLGVGIVGKDTRASDHQRRVFRRRI